MTMFVVLNTFSTYVGRIGDWDLIRVTLQGPLALEPNPETSFHVLRSGPGLETTVHLSAL